MKKKKSKARILLVDGDDPKKELDFELDFMLSLTMRQRYKIMERIYKEGLAKMKRDGYKITPGIFARS